MKVIQIQAEPLTSKAFKPFGEVIGEDAINMSLKKDEKFRMGIIHARNGGFQIRSLNFHKNSTQALVPLEGKACLVVVAPPGAKFKKAKDLKQIKAFSGALAPSISSRARGVRLGGGGLLTMCQPSFVNVFTSSARPAHNESGSHHRKYDHATWPSGYAAVGHQ